MKLLIKIIISFIYCPLVYTCSSSSSSSDTKSCHVSSSYATENKVVAATTGIHALAVSTSSSSSSSSHSSSSSGVIDMRKQPSIATVKTALDEGSRISHAKTASIDGNTMAGNSDIVNKRGLRDFAYHD